MEPNRNHSYQNNEHITGGLTASQRHHLEESMRRNRGLLERLDKL